MLLDGYAYAKAQKELMTAQPCNEADCDHVGICLVDGLIYCGTHAWSRRYNVAVV